jgi:hypothetical protein
MKFFTRHLTCLLLAIGGGVSSGASSAAAAMPAPIHANFRQALEHAHQLLRDHAAGRPLARSVLPAPVAIDPSAQQVQGGPLGLAQRSRLVGTWYVTIPGEGGFNAYQTFHGDGTFTETSSLLGTLLEGPAHGSWFPTIDGGGVLTFELFGFDEQGNSTGRIRVRNRVFLTTPNDFISQTVVDILPNGEEPILAVAEAHISATRQVLMSP